MYCLGEGSARSSDRCQANTFPKGCSRCEALSKLFTPAAPLAVLVMVLLASASEQVCKSRIHLKTSPLHVLGCRLCLQILRTFSVDSIRCAWLTSHNAAAPGACVQPRRGQGLLRFLHPEFEVLTFAVPAYFPEFCQHIISNLTSDKCYPNAASFPLHTS